LIEFITRTLVGRSVCLVVLLVAEVTTLSVWVDNDTLPRAGHLLPLLHDWGPAIIRGPIAFAAVFLTFALLKCGAALERVALLPIPLRWLGGRFCSPSDLFGPRSNSIPDGCWISIRTF